MHNHFKYITSSRLLKAVGLTQTVINRIYHHERKESGFKNYSRSLSYKQINKVLQALDILEDQIKIAKVFFTSLKDQKEKYAEQ